MPEAHYNLVVEPEDSGQRLDMYLVLAVPPYSRSYLQRLIKEGRVLVSGRNPKPSSLVREGDEINVVVPEPVTLEVKPELIPLDILYEDNNLLVLNKKAGITVHPSLNNLTHTLVNGLLYHCKNRLSGISGVLRPGIVHRIDKETSGCLVVAKDDITHNGLARQFHERKILKEYLAIVSGHMQKQSERLEFSLGRHPHKRKRMAVRYDRGKEAITEYEVVKRFRDATFLAIKMGTGRTHQIRVHMSYIGNPILGDKEYGRKKAFLPGIEILRHMLHAYRLGFTHPVTGNWMEFTAPVPSDMEDLLNVLEGQ